MEHGVNTLGGTSWFSKCVCGTSSISWGSVSDMQIVRPCAQTLEMGPYNLVSQALSVIILGALKCQEPAPDWKIIEEPPGYLGS